MADETKNNDVSVTGWQVCYNSGDGVIAVSCVVTSSAGDISGVGLMLNTARGQTLASAYFEFANSEQVVPAINLAKGTLNVGDTVYVVASGQAGGHSFFFEEKQTIVNC